MKKIITTIFLFAFGLSFFSAPALATATGFTGSTEVPEKVNSQSSKTLPNPLGTDNPNVLIGNIINFVLGFVGTIALVLFIYGGFTWMLSAGAPAKVKKGKDIIVWSIIGLFVVFTAYILVRFVIQGVTGIV
jgi:hypothetical protein